MDFNNLKTLCKNILIGTGVAVVSGYLAVQGHNLNTDKLKSLLGEGDLSSKVLSGIGRVLQIPFAVLGIIAGIIGHLASAVAHSFKGIFNYFSNNKEQSTLSGLSKDIKSSADYCGFTKNTETTISQKIEGLLFSQDNTSGTDYDDPNSGNSNSV